jgi:hypothetical protein
MSGEETQRSSVLAVVAVFSAIALYTLLTWGKNASGALKKEEVEMFTMRTVVQ